MKMKTSTSTSPPWGEDGARLSPEVRSGWRAQAPPRDFASRVALGVVASRPRRTARARVVVPLVGAAAFFSLAAAATWGVRDAARSESSDTGTERPSPPPPPPAAEGRARLETAADTIVKTIAEPPARAARAPVAAEPEVSPAARVSPAAEPARARDPAASPSASPNASPRAPRTLHQPRCDCGTQGMVCACLE